MKSKHLPLSEITSLGRKSDAVILRSLSKGTSPDFVPSLRYHFRAGGKRMRAAIVILACLAAGGTTSQSIAPAAAVEMIHNYSLVIDDIIDKGDVRRGVPTVRRKFGEAPAILIAMAYREALDDIIQDCNRASLIRGISVHVMKEIIDGERLDLLLEQGGRKDPYLRDNRITTPDFQIYLRMIGKKTASLFRAAGMIGAHSANANTRTVNALGTFGWKAGLAFQIMDDVLDILGQSTGKQRAKDVIEHKLGNAAILVGMRYLPSRQKNELEQILSTSTISKFKASRAIELISKTPAELECKQIANRYLEEAKGHLRILGESKYLLALSDLADR